MIWKGVVMKNLRLSSIWLALFCGVVFIGNGMKHEYQPVAQGDPEQLVSQMNALQIQGEDPMIELDDMDDALPKCVSKRGKTLWDLLMQASDSVFDDIINFIHHGKKGSILLLSTTGIVSHYPGTVGVMSFDDSFVLDFSKGLMTNLILLVAVQRNMPNFVANVFDAIENGFVILRDFRFFSECLFSALILSRMKIVDIILKRISNENALDYLAKTALRALGIINQCGDQATVSELMENKRFVKLLQRNTPRDVQDFIRYHALHQDLKDAIEKNLSVPAPRASRGCTIL